MSPPWSGRRIATEEACSWGDKRKIYHQNAERIFGIPSASGAGS